MVGNEELRCAGVKKQESECYYRKENVESDRSGIHSISAIYHLYDFDKLFIILEIPFPYLKNGNSDTNIERLFQECNNVHLTIGIQQGPCDVGLYCNYDYFQVKKVIKKANISMHI